MTKQSRLINDIVSDVEIAHKAANELADVSGEVLSCNSHSMNSEYKCEKRACSKDRWQEILSLSGILGFNNLLS